MALDNCAIANALLLNVYHNLRDMQLRLIRVAQKTPIVEQTSLELF